MNLDISNNNFAVESPTTTLLQQAFSLYLQQDYSKSLKVLNSIDESKISINEAVNLKEMKAGCWTVLGQNIDEAIQLFVELIQMQPYNAAFHYSLGMNLYFNGDLDKCVGPLSRAIELEGLDFASVERIVLLMTNALKATKAVNDAQSEFDKGNCPQAMAFLTSAGLVDIHNNKFQEKIKEMSREFLMRDDVMKRNQMDTMQSNTILLINSNQLKEAQKNLNGLDSSPRSLFVKGLFYYKFAFLNRSIIFFKRVLELEPSMEIARTYLEKAKQYTMLVEGATTRMKMDNHASALILLNSAMEVDLDNKRMIQSVFFARAFCKFNLGRSDEAFQDYLMFEALQNETGMVMQGIKF